ncbi:MAG: membrane dipeptidase [Bacteroidales bacterium]|nr:membrane dipeptidase [Bacteroidales bacterium]
MKQFTGILLLIFFVSGCKKTDERLLRIADRIHEKIITVDSHCDTPIEMYRSGFDPGERHDEGCVDFPRMKEGGLDGEFFAVYIGQGPRDDSSGYKAHAEALEIFKVISDNINKNSEIAGLALSFSDAVRLKKEGKRAVFIGMENGYPVGKDISRIKQYYDLGARYITLSHSKNNDICDSSTDPAGPEHNGISEFGSKVIEEMNRLGIMIDVSHISDKSFYDVIEKTKAPVIASHSSCRALCESPRNLTDDMLLALKENGGVIQICILSSYLKTPEPNPRLDSELGELKSRYGDYSKLSEEQKKAMRAEYREIKKKYEKLATIKDVVDHIDHVVQVIGIDHVGIGTDFDGGGGVEGCTSVAGMKNITVELLRRGYSRQEIEKIWGGNLFRVMKKVEEVAASGV